MKPNIPYRFTTGQRRGLMALCVLIVAIQAGWFFVKDIKPSAEENKKEQAEWLALQPELDSLKALNDSVSKPKIYPFNPNFITDYKGYTLGMTTAQIDRLHAYRKQDKWINSVADFKTVTGVSDTLLNKISSYFKFPDWVVKKNAAIAKDQNTPVAYSKSTTNDNTLSAKPKQVALKQLDINTALEEDLIAVRGIGPAFAKKILRRRADLGAFVSMEQMGEFKEFSPEAVSGLQAAFKVGSTHDVARLNINTASLAQLSRFPYFNRDIAKAIITRRSMKGKISDFDELSEIDNIFIVKSKIIRLYLEY